MIEILRSLVQSDCTNFEDVHYNTKDMCETEIFLYLQER